MRSLRRRTNFSALVRRRVDLATAAKASAEWQSTQPAESVAAARPVAVEADSHPPSPSRVSEVHRIWWHAHDRWRREFDLPQARGVYIVNGENWWSYDSVAGWQSNVQAPAQYPPQEFEFAELFAASELRERLEVRDRGSAKFEGRVVQVFEVENAGESLRLVSPGGDSHTLLIDAEHDVVRQLVVRFRGAEAHAVEVLEFSPNISIPPEIFLPPSDTIRFGLPTPPRLPRSR